MTHDEAVKIIGLNFAKLNGSMQQAIATLLKEGDKVRLIKATLEKKKAQNKAVIEARAECGLESYWMEGNVDGLGTALWLLDADMDAVIKESLV